MRHISILSLITAFTATACGASYEGKPVPSREVQAISAEATVVQKSVSGVTVTVDPYLQPERQKEVFDADFTGTGVIAVYVIVKNVGVKPMLIRYSEMKLTTADGTKLVPQSASFVTKTLAPGYNLAPEVFFGLFGAIAQGSSEAKALQARGADYEAKRFKDMMIGTNESATGFVYFGATAIDPKFGEATMHLRMIDTIEGKSSTIALPFSQAVGDGATNEAETGVSIAVRPAVLSLGLEAARLGGTAALSGASMP